MPDPHKLEIQRRGDSEIILTRRFQGSRELVFDCFTKPELIRQWLFGPEGWSLPVCECDLRVGGKIRYVWRREGEPDIGLRGTYQEIDPPRRFVYTEVYDEDWTGGETLVTTEFEESDGETTVTMIVRYASAEALEGALKIGMTDGMAFAYDRLADVLSDLTAGAAGA